MILRAKFHVVLRLLRVLKVAILMLALKCPCTTLKISLSENKTTVNLKSDSFVVIIRLHEGLTHIQSQIKPWLLFGDNFTSNIKQVIFHIVLASQNTVETQLDGYNRSAVLKE